MEKDKNQQQCLFSISKSLHVAGGLIVTESSAKRLPSEGLCLFAFCRKNDMAFATTTAINTEDGTMQKIVCSNSKEKSTSPLGPVFITRQAIATVKLNLRL